VLLRPPEAAAAAAAAAVVAAAAGSTGGGGGGSTIAALGARHNMAEHRERLLGHHKAAALDLRKGARSGVGGGDGSKSPPTKGRMRLAMLSSACCSSGTSVVPGAHERAIQAQHGIVQKATRQATSRRRAGRARTTSRLSRLLLVAAAHLLLVVAFDGSGRALAAASRSGCRKSIWTSSK
jgi:hypothetical protein